MRWWMAAAFLALALGHTQPAAQRDPYAVALDQLRGQIAKEGTDGRFAERFPGSYVFAPLRSDWPQVPVANPDAIGLLAVGPVIRVRGKIDEAGKLRVEGFTPPADSPMTAAVAARAKPLSGILAGVIRRAEKAPAEMNVGGRDVPAAASADGAAIQDAIGQIVEGYKSALANKDEKARRELIDEWARLRTTFVDAFSDSQEAKAIYGSLDNYPPWRYDIVFRQSPSVVALGEAGQTTAFCSGVLVAPDLVLTAAHCFSGPPARLPKNVEVWFGHFDVPNGAPAAMLQRRAINGAVVPQPGQIKELLAGNFNADFLDYAIVSFSPGADAAMPPQCLRRAPLNRGDAVYVLGYPRGNPIRVHASARVYLPFRVFDADEFVRLRMDVETDLVGREEQADLMRQFDASYRAVTIDGAPMRELRHVRDGAQPRMGIVADTFRGNSGGPVYDHEREQCVAGILIAGASDIGLRRHPNWKEHERVLPVEAIIEDLEKQKLQSVLARLQLR